MAETISLFLPLPRAWSTIHDPEARAEVVLERPAGAAFEALTLGTTLGDDLTVNPAAHQRRIARTTDARLTLILHRTGNSAESISLTASDLAIGPIALGRTRRAVGVDPELDVLLQGSFVVPTAGLAGGDLTDWIEPLWPTGDLSAVTHLRIEPDGLYLQGRLPGALFADAADRTVALRVPQLAGDLVDGPDADPRHRGRFWSLTSFQFPDLPTDSRVFVREHAKQFERFRLQTNGDATDPSAPRRSDTFVDNLAIAPPAECTVRIFRDGDALEWDARPPGVRLVIAAGRSDETTFFPRALTGRAERSGGAFARDSDRPVQFESGIFDPTKVPIRLEASNRGGSGQVDFRFPAESLVALSVPIVPPSPPGGPPPLPEQAGDLGPDAPREPVRNWICTRDGWLQLDAERPVSAPTPGLPERDVSGVLPLDTLSGALLRALDPDDGDEAVAGLEVRTEALAAGHIAIALDRAPDGAESLRLELHGARTTVLTPRVWFAPRTGPGPDAPRDAVPSLTAAALPEATQADALDLDQESDEQREARAQRLEARLDEVLQPATFVTPPPETLGDLNIANARRLYAEISWDAAQRRFRFGFPADRLVAWQRPSLPLVTNYPLTPPSDRDAYLDSNRGLIPFVRAEPIGASGPRFVPVGFPARALPRLLDDDVAPPDFPRGEDDGWTPAREVRVFLPTLPGLEADIATRPTDWAYRHAVPALDEAYAEAREADDGPAVVNPGGRGPDLARVEGAAAFTIGTAEAAGASGWLPIGAAPIHDAVTAGLETANPRLTFRLGASTSAPITFDRGSGVAELSADLSSTFNDGPRPDFAALALTPVTAAQAGEEAIIHNGQPMLTRWSPTLGAVVALDGDGLVRAEPTGRDQLAWPPGATDPIVRRTASLTLRAAQAVHTLDLVGVTVGRAPEPDELGLERWSWTEGGTWPSLLGFPLYPLQLASLEADGTTVLRAVLLPRPPDVAADPLHAPGFAAGSVLLTFRPTAGADELELAEVAGDLDWRFPVPPEAPESEPRVERVVADVTLDSGGDSLALAIREVAVRHEVGLLRLVPGASADRDGSIVVDPAPDGPVLRARLQDSVERARDGARLVYQVALHVTPGAAGATEQTPVWDGYLFRWSSDLPEMEGTADRPRWELANGDPAPPVDGDGATQPTRWQLRLSRTSQDLVGVLGVEPHRIGARDLLFPIKALLRSPDVADRSWFRTTPLLRGFAAVTFTPGGDPATVPLPAVFAAEIPLSFAGRTADRTIQVFDPQDDTFHTLDRGTEAVALGDDGRPLPALDVRLANATLVGTSQDEIVFARSQEPGQLVSMSLPRNVTSSKPFVAGVTTRAMTVIRLIGRNIAVTVDDAENVRAWDLTSDGPPRPLPASPTSAIEGPLGIVTVADSRVSALGALPPNSGVEVVAWARISADGGSDAGVYVWEQNVNFLAEDVGPGSARLLRRVNPHIPGLSPTTTVPPVPDPGASAITAIAVTNDGHVISGARDGSLLVWKRDVPFTQLPVVFQRMEHGTLPISAVAALIAGDDRIVSADESGTLKIWPPPPDTGLTAPPATIHEAQAQHVIDHGSAVAALVPLGFDSTTQRTQFAVLDRDGAATLYKVLLASNFSGEDTVFQRERLDTRGASVRSIAPLPIDDKHIQLLLDGVAPPTRLEGVLRAGTAGLSIEVSGRLTAQDAIEYEDPSVPGARCTHRADLLFDRARVPLESLFRGAGPPRPLSLGAVVEHTYRFPRGPERVWQTPQVVRLMRAADFVAAYGVTRPADDDLVIDAGAVHWLQWVDRADREPGGAASVSNDRLSILLRPREVGRMQRGAPRTVRLPTVLQRDPFAPGLKVVLKVPTAAGAALDALTLAADTSGAQPIQPPPESLPVEVAEPPVDSRADADDSVSYFDRAAEAAWLDERFLHGLLIPRRTPGLAIDDLAQPPTGPVSPILNNTNVGLDSTHDLGDLAWLRLTARPSHLPEGAEDLRSLGPISRRRLQPQLAAATVANKHRPGGPESLSVARLDGPTLAEFPFVVESGAPATAGPSRGSALFQDVQLVVFEGGRFRRLERVQLPIGADPVAWASDLRAARRRRDALFLFVEASRLLLLPRSFQSAREDLRAAWPWEVEDGGEARPIPEPRCVSPGAVGGDLVGDPGLSLTVFGARPVGPHPVDRPVKGVAATRFRLAPTPADGPSGAGRLRAARIDPTQPLAYSALDEVRFAAQSEGRSYPRADPGALARRPDPAIAPEPDTVSLLLPLLDVVAWAARPGEQTRTTWSLRRVGAALGPAVRTSLRRPRAKPGVEEAVRLQALGQPVLAGRGRFCERAFRLTQVIDSTRFLPVNEDGDRRVYAVLTTRSELFRSSSGRDAASTGPARVYTGEPSELTLIAAAGGIPDVQTAENPDGTGPVPVAIPFLLYLNAGEDPKDVPDGPRKLKVGPPPLGDWKPVGDPADNVFLQKFPVPEGLSADFEILIMIFRRDLPPTPGDLPDLAPNGNDVRACLKVDRLDRQGRFRAPKMGVSLLARTRASDPVSGPYRLSGYGRLGDAAFTPIRPGRGRAPGDVDWSRLAGLRTLDRVDERDDPLDPFAYDVVVYGPGGELLPTDPPSSG
ncbi:WD40 repeat domain-containing protein [Paludisphaera rhizosphaerae]|uniref:hypothetical protein n=1 Tax=Paludisphaera rhizosphaerae TaxID=2711216 RepID=UPI0013EAE378|nr:hypothetical protein [Paludisphaera rhizosphaerae]